jgi:hypothetical protein
VIVPLAFAAVTALAIVALRGDFRGIGRIQLRGEVLLVSLFLLQGLARGRLLTPLALRLSWNPVAPWLITTIALLIVLLWNVSTTGVPVAAVGTALNLVVVAANGAMPVSPSASLGSRVVSATTTASGFYSLSASNLRFLGDVISAPPTGGGSELLFSAGDLLLFTGVCLVVLSATARIASHYRE